MRFPDWLRCSCGPVSNLPNHTRPDRGLARYGKITIASVDYVSPTAELDRDSTKKDRMFSIVIVLPIAVFSWFMLLVVLFYL